MPEPRSYESKEIFGFSREDLGDGNVDRASCLDGKKEDHKTTNLKDIPRRKLQEKQQNKFEKSEDLDQLESWHKELSAAGGFSRFSFDI